MNLVDSAPEAAQRAAVEYAPGQVLDGRYRLVYRIGRGGFGDVWRAEELLPDGAPFREVALKLLLATFGDAGSWAEEAKLLASFRHPSLVTIYAAGILGTAQPQRFVAMELLEGQNLSDVSRARGQIPWRRVLRWACSAAAALDAIHLRGVVHLDLKPANLFLASDGALKVLDFGIARRAGSRAPLRRRSDRGDAGNPRDLGATLDAALLLAGHAAYAMTQDVYGATRPMAPGITPTVIHADRERRTMTLARAHSAGQDVLIGTPGFMAPEVLEMAEPTAAADAYALAVCVVQLITGRLPHAAADEPTAWDDPTAVSDWLHELQRATLRGELRDFASSASLIPGGLASLLHRLLAVDPRSRGVEPGRLSELFEEVWERPSGVPDPPYLGLTPFTAEAEGVLFGRDDDIGRLGRELEYEPAVVLQGVHGGGKSSLASAGLVPYLGLRGIDGKDDWIAARVEPGEDPDAALASALAALAPELREASPEALAAYAGAAPIGIVLLVDPLEAAITAPPARRGRLDALMAAIAEGSATPRGTQPSIPDGVEPQRPAGRITPGLRLVAALGEEYTASLLADATLGEALRAALRFVGAPSVAAVADIVGGPAHFAGVPVYGMDAIVDEVQRELRTGAFRLPYVALALRAFWEASVSPPTEQRRSYPDGPLRGSVPPRGGPTGSVPPSALRGERWKELGGVRGVLARHADQVIAGFDQAERSVASEMLLRLAATDGKPLRWSEDELLDTLGPEVDRARASRVLDVLVREHLVRRSAGSVEIGHEALLTIWSHLTSSRLHQMDRLVFLERVREAAQAWERADNHRDLLLHGALLEEMMARREWAFRGLTPRERVFVDASRRRARYRRVTHVLLGLFIAFGVLGGVLGKSKLDRASDAEAKARALAAEREETAELAAKSRRAEEPYRRVAYIAAAMARGAADGMLPLELARVASSLPRADFLTLEHVAKSTFPWDDRWAVAQRGSSTLTLVDFAPLESEPFDDEGADPSHEAAASARFQQPKVTELRPHDDPLAEWSAFAFDTSIVTRSVTGEVKVIRVRPDGAAVVAATAPFRCAGAIQLAEAAPVLACATAEGIVRWDLRKARSEKAAVARHTFSGNVASISPDGARVAGVELRRVLLWAPDEGREAIYTASAPVAMALWSPRDAALAVIRDTGVEVVDWSARRDNIAPTQIAREAISGLPSSARWDEAGLDLGLCEASGAGRWLYLRPSARAKDEPTPRGSPCAARRPAGKPEPFAAASEMEELAGKDLGPHLSAGGFRLKNRRLLTHDMVLFDAADNAAARLLRFHGHDEFGGEDPRGPDDGMVAAERSQGIVALQLGHEVRVYALVDGNRLSARPGHLLRRCSDGRIAAWLASAATFHIFDARSGSPIGEAPREPGIVVGADSACDMLYFQRLDGTLVEHPITSEGPGRALAVADGYVFDARPSPARASLGPGIWLALSSGAIARIDEASGSVRLFGYATPRAAAVADGPRPGEVAFIDSTGVVTLGEDGAMDRILEASGEVPWEDLSVAPDGASLLLTSAEQIALLDLARREITGSIPASGKARFSPWDEEGSVFAWSFNRAGGPEGIVIPRGVPLAQTIAAGLSNLHVDKGKLVIKR